MREFPLHPVSHIGKTEVSYDSVERFATLLIAKVRDQAIDSFDVARNLNAKSQRARRYRELFGTKLEAAIDNVVPDIVDVTLFYLLNAIENGELRLLFDDNGKIIDLDKEGFGEMAGNYVADDPDSWRQKYSRSRIF